MTPKLTFTVVQEEQLGLMSVIKIPATSVEFIVSFGSRQTGSANHVDAIKLGYV